MILLPDEQTFLKFVKLTEVCLFLWLICSSVNISIEFGAYVNFVIFVMLYIWALCYMGLCYCCQRFASEICNSTSKCVKYSGQHVTTNCPTKGRITHTFANYCCLHPVSYRRCPRNTLNQKKNSSIQTKNSKITRELINSKILISKLHNTS